MKYFWKQIRKSILLRMYRFLFVSLVENWNVKKNLSMINGWQLIEETDRKLIRKSIHNITGLMQESKKMQRNAHQFASMLPYWIFEMYEKVMEKEISQTASRKYKNIRWKYFWNMIKKKEQTNAVSTPFRLVALQCSVWNKTSCINAF